MGAVNKVTGEGTVGGADTISGRYDGEEHHISLEGDQAVAGDGDRLVGGDYMTRRERGLHLAWQARLLLTTRGLK